MAKIQIVKSNGMLQGFGKEVDEIVNTQTKTIIGYMSKIDGVPSIYVPRPVAMDDIVEAIGIAKQPKYTGPVAQ